MKISSYRILVALFVLMTCQRGTALSSAERGQAVPAVPVSVSPAGLKGTLQHVKVHGSSLEGNLEGDSPDRDVSIYLPPSYASDRARRYPVLYVLHGYTGSDEKSSFNLPTPVEKALAGGEAKEMIVVMPNAYTVYQGSMYSNSVATGNWEAFIAEDLVSYIDGHYRTIANAASRGLAGHSMGGYGTIRIAMKRPGVFSSIYLVSACCMSADWLLNYLPIAKAESVKSAADLAEADFYSKLAVAAAAAWSPNPKGAPLFFDLPRTGGDVRSDVAAKWAANAILAMVDQYIPNLRKLHAIGMDSGSEDTATGIVAATQALHELLNRYAIVHSFEIYSPGTHTSRIAERFETTVLPFFSRNLAFVPQ